MHIHRLLLRPLLCCLFCLQACSFAHGQNYGLHYEVKMAAASDIAELKITIDSAELVERVSFNLHDSQCSGFESDDKLENDSDRLNWYPNGDTSELRYRCQITHRRPSKTQQAYDALTTEHGAIFRGDDLFPAARVRSQAGATSKASLQFELPENWSVHTGWLEDRNNPMRFIIDNPRRRFDRPTGWMIVGELGTRKSQFEFNDTTSEFAVSAFKGSGFRRMDTLVFTQFVWPELARAFNTQPPSLLIVGAQDPLWRGGLSAGNSLYLHADRPLVSENGTSTLTHELVHVFTRLKAEKGDDWIVEGLAEYYSVELLYRAGGLTQERRALTMRKLCNWSKDITSLKALSSKGKRSAAAALLFAELDKEIRTKSKGKFSLDTLTQRAMTHPRVSLEQLRSDVRALIKQRSEVLESELLPPSTS
jgi:predicted metalloprotease with PDZ domain